MKRKHEEPESLVDWAHGVGLPSKVTDQPWTCFYWSNPHYDELTFPMDDTSLYDNFVSSLSVSNRLMVQRVEHDGHTGKWMLFYPLDELDEAWLRVLAAMDAGRLRGICGFKCSTAGGATMRAPTHTAYSREHAMILYCGGSEEQVLRIGRELVKEMGYRLKPYVYYKLNAQTGLVYPGPKYAVRLATTTQSPP